jgi:hypothetical protein
MKRIAALLMLAAAAQAAPADKPSSNDDDATLLERLLVTPRDDLYSSGDRHRHAIERSLPGPETGLPPTGWDAFLDSIANADVNRANPEQRLMIEKLDDPDANRLPR